MGYYPQTLTRYGNPSVNTYGNLTSQELDVIGVPSVILYLSPKAISPRLSGTGFYPIKIDQADKDGHTKVRGGSAMVVTGVGGINGNAAFSFDGESWLEMPNFTLPGTYSIFTVIRHTSTSVVRPIFGCQDAPTGFYQQFYINASNQLANRISSTQITYGTALANATNYIVGVSFSDIQTSTNTRLYVGNSTTPVASGQINFTKKNFPSSSLFGGSGSADWRWQSLAGPVIILDKAVHVIANDPDLVKVLALLQDYVAGTAGKYV